jgi:sulfotransferase
LLKIHFISGLPRSGSTLLAAILKQNPAFHAGIESPLAGLFAGAIRSMSMNETSLFVTDAQRERILRAIAEAYYADVAMTKLPFDTHRSWCKELPALSQVFPEARVICCLRNTAWILDSIERLVQRNALLMAKMFGDAGNVYSRVESLMKDHLVGPALNSTKQAWFSEHADRLIAIRYDSLADRPKEVIAKLYELLGEQPYVHDFDRLDYDEVEFDSRLGMPGLHKVAPRVEAKKRATILPADLFAQYDREFWEMPGQNPKNVIVL